MCVRASRWLVCLLLLGPCVPCALAQRAQIAGQIVDQSGAPIPCVKLNVLNLSRGLTRESLTTEDGTFHFPLLQPGDYVLTAQRDGFGSAEVRELRLGAEDTLRLRLTLRVGMNPTVVRVTEASDGSVFGSPSLGGTFPAEAINSTALFGRDVTSLAIFLPGVLPSPPGAYGKSRYHISGGRPDSITFLLDGGLDNDLLYNRIAYLPNLDSIAEFRVQTSNYPAEYGRNAGGVISIATKSGTAELHGNVFDYFQNDRLNANSFFNNLEPLPRDPMRQNQFGFSLGGPDPFFRRFLDKDRLFFFFSYEGTRRIHRVSVHDVFTYTASELNGDFSQAGPPDSTTGLPTPDQGVAAFLKAYPYYQPDPTKAANAIIDPTRLDLVTTRYIKAGFLPTSPTGYATSQGDSSDDGDELISKLDYVPSSTDHFAFTIGVAHNNSLDPFTAANVSGFPVNNQIRTGFLALSYSVAISPRIMNVFQFSVNLNDRKLGEPARKLPGPSDLGINIQPDFPTGPTSLLFSSGMRLGFSDNGPSRFVSNTYSVTNTLSWDQSKHHMSAGGGLSVFQNNTRTSYLVNGQFVFYGTATANDLADFLLGLPSAYLQGPYAPTNIRSKSMFGFFQDAWNLLPRLTVDLGLRYEFSTPKTDTQNRLYSIVPGMTSTQFPNAPVGMLFPGDYGAPLGTNFPDRNNWAPRFNFAWSPWSDRKTLVRGGFGVFYDILKAEDNLQFNGQEPFASSANLYFNAPPGISSPQNFLSDPFAAAGEVNPFPSRPPPANLDFDSAGLLPIGGVLRDVFVVDPHLRTPYTFQYSLNLQRELGAGILFQAGYVGSSSHGLTALADINPMVLGTSDRVLNLAPGNSSCTSVSGTCSFASIREFKNVARAGYNSLELQLRKVFSESESLGGTYFSFGYTYSHSVDNASGFGSRNSTVPAYSPSQFRASSDADLRHRLVLCGGWTLPLHKYLPRLPGRFSGGWNVSGFLNWRTGFPLDVFANSPAIYDFTSTGSSGAGDPGLVRANLISPYHRLDPRSFQTFRGNQGNYWFDPGIFSNSQCQTGGFLPSAASCTPGPGMFPSDAQALFNPSLRTYGSLPRNFFRGPSRTSLDLAVSKRVSLPRENMALEFRVESFNVLNHALFSDPSTEINDFFFGQITDTADPRTIQLGLRFSF